MGGLDIVVPNAAATVFGDFTEVDAEAFDEVIAVTFTGAVNTVRGRPPHLERSAGRDRRGGVGQRPRAPADLLQLLRGQARAARAPRTPCGVELRGARQPGAGDDGAPRADRHTALAPGDQHLGLPAPQPSARLLGRIPVAQRCRLEAAPRSRQARAQRGTGVVGPRRALRNRAVRWPTPPSWACAGGYRGGRVPAPAPGSSGRPPAPAGLPVA
ncbi:MAG: SDR family NAD(P)-dependent oxidoreductase [Thermoleophilaceae bacterium]